MKTSTAVRTFMVAAIAGVTLSCMFLQPQALEPTPAIWYEVSTVDTSFGYPTAALLSTPALPPTAAPMQTAVSASTNVTGSSITGAEWDSSGHFVNVKVTPWPASWEKWVLYVDGTEIATSETSGSLDVRPNAPVNAGPTGFLVATVPWPASLERSSFPCCGSLQFSVPDMGMTNAYSYNLKSAGCKTASAKVCTP